MTNVGRTTAMLKDVLASGSDTAIVVALNSQQVRYIELLLLHLDPSLRITRQGELTTGAGRSIRVITAMAAEALHHLFAVPPAPIWVDHALNLHGSGRFWEIVNQAKDRYRMALESGGPQ